MLSTLQTSLKKQSLLQRVEQINTLVFSPYYLMLVFLHIGFIYLRDIYATLSSL